MPKSGPELLEEIAQHVTLDEYMKRDPKTIPWPEGFMEVVQVQRADRARFIQGEAQKKAKKQGIIEEAADADAE